MPAEKSNAGERYHKQMRKRIWKAVLALVLLLSLTVGDMAWPGGPVWPQSAASAAGESGCAAGENQAELRSTVDNRLQAKSKKKKKTTATPTVKPTETPKPAKTEKPAETAQPGKSKNQSDTAKTGATAPPSEAPTPTPVPEGPIIDPQSIADYLFSHDMTLPENFITKKEARDLGWDSYYNDVSDVAPGKSIGGDYFGNYEGRLPVIKGVKYYEADCYYTKGNRNADRVIFSTDGRVWYTGDHYNTFEELFPTVP